jgi:hypothetical protein
LSIRAVSSCLAPEHASGPVHRLIEERDRRIRNHVCPARQGRFHVVAPAAHYMAGTTISAGELCDLAHAWWSDRLRPDWQPHTRDQNQAILERLGLTGQFWQLP